LFHPFAGCYDKIEGWRAGFLEFGKVTGRIIRVHTKDFHFKGYTHHATQDEPQYEIKSFKADHIAAHKAAALTLLKD
jgi:hypothetical protein